MRVGHITALLVSRAIGLIGVALALVVVPVAYVDPALSGFAGWGAIVVSAVASISMRNARLALATIGLSATGFFFLSHYSPNAGWTAPTTSSIAQWLAVVSIPLIPAVVLICIGEYRRHTRGGRRWNPSN
jgi:hypothetical protein